MVKWCMGYIDCRVKSGHWERFMNLCRHHQIKLWHIRIEENGVRFRMHCDDYKSICIFVGKTKVVPHICAKKGLPFVMEQALWDWTFTFGLLLFFVVLKVLSLFVWQVTYSGQREYTKETVNKEVMAMGVYPGMLRKNLNCDSIERSLRERYDNMSWVSAEEKGCVLNIKIKEGNVEKAKEQQENTPCHILAPCDGIIQSIVTREGTPQVKQGMTVKQGDVLIRGVVEIKDDNGETAKYNGVAAQGEIAIQTEEIWKDSIKAQHMVKNKTNKNVRVYTIEWNGTRFHIKNPLKWLDNSASYDIINNVCADWNFIPLQTNLRIIQREYISYKAVSAEYNEKEAAELLGRRFLSCLAKHEEERWKVIDKSLEITKEKAGFTAEGRIKMLVTNMNTSPVNSEELLLPDHGKEDDDGTGTVDS